MDNIDNLLLELKRVLSVVDDNYISKIKSILAGDSEYDKLFYHYVDKLGLDKGVSKQLCSEKIKSVSKNNSISDYYIIKEINGSVIFTDIYSVIDDNVSDYYDDLDYLQRLIINKDNIISGINAAYGINKNNENIYTKLYLAHIFYSYMLSYIDIFDDNDSFVNEDNDYIDVYKSFNQIDNIKDIIDVFDNYVDEIIDIYELYLDLDKHGRNLIHLKVLNSDNLKTAIKICPFSIMMYKNFYNMYYKNEKLKSIELGDVTLTIINDMIKASHDNNKTFNDAFKDTVLIIKNSKKEYDIFKWINYLVANVYENLLVKDKLDINEKRFMEYINQVGDSIINNNCLLEYVIYKFYEFNHVVYDLKSLKELRDTISFKDKKIIKKINPYYTDIDRI